MSKIIDITIAIDGKDDHSYSSAMLHSIRDEDFTVYDIAEMARTELDQINSFRAENDITPAARVDLMVTFEGGLVAEGAAQ